jgi:hypothetical protein
MGVKRIRDALKLAKTKHGNQVSVEDIFLSRNDAEEHQRKDATPRSRKEMNGLMRPW